MDYNIIVADPPWRYSFSKSKSRQIENQYPTMDINEICNLNVQGITSENAVLYLWATAPKLLEAIKTMYYWGFTYKTQMVWDKQRIGMGYWTRGRHEIILIGTKGKAKPPEPQKRIGSILEEKRDKHSKKTQLLQDMIDSQFPAATKLEMFARNTRQGWDCWGNEVEDNQVVTTTLLTKTDKQKCQQKLFKFMDI